MNKFFLPFFLFFSLIFISTVFSKELPEDSSSGILKNVTADLTKDSDDIKLKYKAGKGLEFKGGDAFKLNLGARIQFRFDSADYNQAASGTQDSGTRVVSSLASIEGKEGRTHDFMTRRFQITFSGYAYNPNIFYKYVLCSDKNGTDCVGSGSGLGIEDAYFGYKFGKGKILMGQWKLPFTVEEQTSSSNLEYVDRSANQLTFERDHQIRLEIEPNSQIKATAALGAGLGGNKLKSNQAGEGTSGDESDGWDKVEVYRLEITPFGKMKYSQADLKKSDSVKLRFGVARLYWRDVNLKFDGDFDAVGSRGKFDDRLDDFETAYYKNDKNGAAFQGNSFYTMTATTFDAGIKYNGLFAEFEHTINELKDKTLGKGTESINWTRYQVSYHIRNGWVTGFRYGVLDQSDRASDEITEKTITLSKFFVGHNLKINADYGWLEEELGPKTTVTSDQAETTTFRIQAQLKF